MNRRTFMSATGAMLGTGLIANRRVVPLDFGSASPCRTRTF